MPAVTFNFTTAQVNRIQQATDLYNTQTGASLTAKQFVFWCVLSVALPMLREDIEKQARDTNFGAIETDLGMTVG